ncbi:MAG: aspartate aminotransferase family protein [Burkholderiaceae bacterium]|nr:aspartate aminotransferase family protein [Burkholderiaceae bacterium]
MYLPLQQDALDTDALLHTACQYAVQVLGNMPDRPVASQQRDIVPQDLPEHGMGFQLALNWFKATWEPGFSGSAGPRYLGFVTGGATPASLAGDWLTSTYDQNPTSSLDSSAPNLERQTVAWLRELFGLDTAHQGAFVTGATMSNMVGLAIAREWLGQQQGIDVSQQGVAALGDVTILSGAPHSSIYKALSMLGLGRQAVKSVALLPGREAIDLTQLEAALQVANGPVIVVANAGTVNTVDFDDLAAIVALKQRYSFWLHVDGAFGAFAALSPSLSHWVQGLDAADSICIDCHKWLNVPYDSAVQFTRHRDLQLRVFQNSAAYLGMPTENPDFVHLTPENSRRLRALPAWFTLAAYGRAGHRDIVERNVACAHRLGELISQDSRLQLLAPVILNVVCFTLAGGPDQEAIQAYLERIGASGQVFLTATVLHGLWAVRAAFSNWQTQAADVDRVFAAIQAGCIIA